MILTPCPYDPIKRRWPAGRILAGAPCDGLHIYKLDGSDLAVWNDTVLARAQYFCKVWAFVP